MKTRLALLVLCSLFSAPALMAQSTAFTYQGRLSAGGSPANNLYEMQFTLFDSVTNGSQVGLPVSIAPVPVSNGLFTVTLDFGAAAFMGANRWLEITLNIFGTDMVPTTLQPRQPISPTPYAIYAANAAGLMSFANAPLDIKINGERALRLEPTVSPAVGDGRGAPNVIGGSKDNYVVAGVIGATIAGGGATEWYDGGYINRVLGHFGTVSGGLGNTASGVAATVSGGFGNFSSGSEATLGGGGNNTSSGDHATVSGGAYNTASGLHSVVGGGRDNWATNEWSTIGGGLRNVAQGSYSVIGGGNENVTAAEYSTIGGGDHNVTAGFYATVGGGRGNTSSGGFATVAGGQQNGSYGEWATVSGGFNNTSYSLKATVGGGGDNYASGDCATVAGGGGNVSGFEYATVGGGQGNRSSEGFATVGGGQGNITSGYSSTIGGGRENWIGPGEYGTIGGGSFNTNSGSCAVLGGGRENNIAANSSFSTIAGGTQNDIGIDSDYSAIGGGFNNNIASNSFYSTIGGGNNNNIAANTSYATIPGGEDNAATHYAFAAGRRAKANHTGAFVWGDSSDADVRSTNDNSMTLRASGGMRVFSDGGLSAGVYLAPGSGTWSSLSDRHAKENFTVANGREILDKVAALPLASWNYKAQDKSIRHLGPMAQDFHAAFGLGESERTITTVDADGVALAAIQGLNQKLEEQLQAKDTELRALKRQVDELRELVQSLANSPLKK